MKPAKRVILFNFTLLFLLVAAIYVTAVISFNNKLLVATLVLCPQIGNTPGIAASELSGVKRQNLFIDTPDGKKLHAALFELPGAKKFVVVNHGNAGNIENRLFIADALIKAKCSVLLYDYQGYGTSTGTSTVDSILQDGLTVYDYAQKELKQAPENMVIYGESIGSGVTCFVAQRRVCCSIILQSGLASLPAAGRSLFPMLWLIPDFLMAEPHLDNAQIVKSLHVPILIMHGEKDRTISVSQSKTIFQNANQPKTLVLVPDCGHNDMGYYDAEQFHSAIGRFLK